MIADGTSRATPYVVRAARVARFATRVLLTWSRAARVAADAEATADLAVDCARRALDVLRIDVVMRGAPSLEHGPVLVVANHVSWIDIHVLNALGRARFVAKSEVREWPVVGPMTAAFGTFFHVRGNFRDAARVKDAIAAALRRGERVVVFPEGTTTDGTRVAPFHAALLQAAIDGGAPVQPVALRYVGPDGGADPAAAFVDDMSFADSLSRVLGRSRLRVDVHVAPPFATAGATRRELTFASRRWITAALLLESTSTPERRRTPRPRRAA